MSYFKDAQSRDPLELIAGARTRTFWGDHVLLSLVEIDAGAEVPKHTHPHEQAGIVIEGEIEMGIGGEVRTIRPGDMYIIPGDVEHYARSGGTRAKILDIFSPVREEFKY